MRALAAVVVALSLLGSSAARAQDESSEEAPAVASVASATLPFFVTLGIGTSIRLDGTIAAQMRIQEELGVHFDGTATGPFASVVLAEDFLAIYSMQVGIRVGWDLALLSRDFAIIAQPSVLIPFAFDVGPASSTYAYFCPQIALGVGVLFLDGMLAIWIRPIAFDIYIGENIHGAYTAVGGAAFNFGL